MSDRIDKDAPLTLGMLEAVLGTFREQQRSDFRAELGQVGAEMGQVRAELIKLRPELDQLTAEMARLIRQLGDDLRAEWRADLETLETKLLGAFFSYQDFNRVEMRKLQADVSNVRAASEQQIANLASRVEALERIILRSRPPGRTTPSRILTPAHPAA